MFTLLHYSLWWLVLLMINFMARVNYISHILSLHFLWQQSSIVIASFFIQILLWTEKTSRDPTSVYKIIYCKESLTSLNTVFHVYHLSQRREIKWFYKHKSYIVGKLLGTLFSDFWMPLEKLMWNSKSLCPLWTSL